MTRLAIFSLDDTKEENGYSLSEGEHIIGRGVLNCHDKRVSRQHALITICKDLVTIKAIHVNPCFFKAAEGGSITILSKNTSILLNDGDQFAFLASLFWYKVKVLKDNDGDTTLNSLQNVTNTNTIGGDSEKEISISHSKSKIITSHTTVEISDKPSTSKRNHVEEKLEETSKRQKITGENVDNTNTIKTSFDELNKLNSSANLDMQNTSANVETENIAKNIDAHKLFDNLKTIVEEDYGNKNVSSNVSNGFKKIKEEGFNKGNERNNDAETEGKYDAEVKREVLDDANVIENNNVEVNLSGFDNAQSVKTNILQTEDNKGNSCAPENDNAPNEVAKVEDGGSGENTATNSNKEDDGNKASCSTNDKNKNTRRERCWYGPTCYRKNPVHRQDFSHPGDDDYDSDPDDERPLCPFGGACYRKNLLHRRQYKHTNPPVPKPSKINLQVNVNNTCPFCPHCNTNRFRKPNYESDYESDYEY